MKTTHSQDTALIKACTGALGASMQLNQTGGNQRRHPAVEFLELIEADSLTQIWAVSKEVAERTPSPRECCGPGHRDVDRGSEGEF